jgi:hypothetical protein
MMFKKYPTDVGSYCAQAYITSESVGLRCAQIPPAKVDYRAAVLLMHFILLSVVVSKIQPFKIVKIYPTITSCK